MSIQSVVACRPAAQPPLLHAWLAVEAALVRWRQRRELLTLDDRTLRDIGIDHYDAVQEAAKGWRE